MISVENRASLQPGRVRLDPVNGQPNMYDMERADEPQQAGTPLNRRTMQLLQADLRTYPVAAGQSITAGDVVDVVGGEVTKAGTPSRCIALQSATAGQPCEVIFDGVSQLPGALAGREINSPGVYGYCPQDGWVWVRPEWDGKPFVTGSYVGTGIAVTRAIELGFIPCMVILRGVSSIDVYSTGNLGVLFQGQTISTGSGASMTTMQLSGSQILLNVGNGGSWNTTNAKFNFIAF